MKKKTPTVAVNWARYLVSHAAVGSALGLGAAALVIASPGLGLPDLLANSQLAAAAVVLIALAFASLSAAAFLAMAMSVGDAPGGGGRRRAVALVPVRAKPALRQLPRRNS